MKNIFILAAVLFIALYYIMAEVIWKLRDRIFRRRLITGVLIMALLLSQTSIVNIFTKTDAGSAAAAEAENEEIITISDFAELPDDIREQTVPVGTSLEELELPDALEAVCVVACADVDADTDADTNVGADADEGTDADTGADTDADTGADTDADTGADTDADKGTDTDMDTDADQSTDAEADTNSGDNATLDEGVDTDTDTDVDSDADTDTDADIDAGNDADTSVDTDTDVDVTPEDNTLGESVADAEGDTEKIETFSVTMPEYQTEHIIEVKTMEADSLTGNSDEHSEDSKDTEPSVIPETSQETITIANIIWQSEPEYNGDVEGEYIFTAVLPEGYVLTDGVDMPQITVTVGEADNIALLSGDGIMAIAATHTSHNGITSAWSNTSSLPSSSGSYYLTGNVSLSGTWTAPSGTTTLCLNGNNITFSSGYISVPSGNTLNIYDCQDSGTVKGTTYGIFISSGTVTINGGTITATSDSGIYIGGTGRLTVHGGTITSTSTAKHGITTDTSSQANLSMDGGTVTTEKAAMTAIYLEGKDTASISGGTICNDNTTSASGAFYIGGSCQVTITGGIIRGTLYGIRNEGTTSITNATVSGGDYGLRNQGTVTIKSGSFTGGKTYAIQNEGSINLSGSPTITGSTADIYLPSGKKITITGTLSNTTPYSVSTATTPTSSSPVVITDSSSTSYNDKTKFTSKNSSYVVRKNSSSQLELALPATYTITYNAGDYSSGTNKSATKKEGTNLTLLGETFTRTGYTQTGWSKSSSGTSRDYALGATYSTDASVTLYPYWTANTYTVTYNKNGGTIANESNYTSYTYGAGLTLPTPIKTGYTFGGWYTSSSLSGTEVTRISATDTGNKTYYAKWAATTYTITYNLNSGTNNSSNPANYTIETATITLKDPTRTGYTFEGWYDNSSFSGTKVTSITKGSTGNKTFYAKWTAKKYTVSFDSAGGSSVPSIEVTYDSTYGTLTTPTRMGYKFDGWYTTETGSTKVVSATKVSIANDHTLYAHWTGNPYDVTLKYQDGKTADKTISVTYGSTYGSNLSTKPSRAGYNFVGWFTAAEGGVEVKSDTEVTTAQAHTLYARWVDDIAPVIGELTYNYSTKNVAGYVIGNKNLTITVPVTELGSGADEIEYTATAVKGTSKSGTAAIEANGTAQFTVDADFEGSIEITCTDNASNESSKAVKVILEGNAPTVSFEINGSAVSGETNYYDESPAVDVTVTDDMNNAISGGIASVAYQVDGSDAKTVNGGFTASIVPQYSFTIPADKIPTGVNDITVKVEDNAGNTVETTLTVKVKGPEVKPDAEINYISENLTGLVSGAEYTVNGVTKTANTAGTIPIEESWIGDTISIIKKGNGDTTSDSAEQSLFIPARPSAPSAPTLSDRTDTAITLETITGAEYRISCGSWQSSRTFGGLMQKTQYCFEAYYPATQSSFCSLASETATIGTRPTPPTTDKLIIDYIAETFSLAQGVEAFSDADASSSITEGSIESYMGETVYIRYAETDDFPESDTRAVSIPDRPAAPSGFTAENATYPGAKDGSVTGLDTGYPYEISADEGNTWKDAQWNGTDIIGLSAGSYRIRIKSAADKNFQSEASATFIIGEDQPRQEDTPDAKVDCENENLKGLTPNGEYTINGETRQTDQNGNIHIEEEWIDKDVDIVKKGNGTTTTDSDKQTVHIPTREKKPNPKTTDVSAKGKSDGKITNLELYETYEISKDGGKTWETVTADSKGEITGLPAGDYKIRTKGKDDADGGTLCSEAADCKIGTKSSSNSGSSSSGSGGDNDNSGGSSGSGGDDNSGGQPNDDIGSDQTDNTPEDSVTPPADTTTLETDASPTDTAKADTPKKETPTTEETKKDTGKTQEESGKSEQSTTPESEPSADTADQTAPAETENDEINIMGESIATGTIKAAQGTTTTITVGEGSVSVTVVNDEYRHVAGVADTVAVANAVLTREQKQHVNDGGKIEIRVEVKDISGQVSQQDKETIESGLADYKITSDADTREQGELILGAYIDISMFIKIGDGDWDAITQSGEPIEVVIGIPDELQSDGRTYYIARCHEGEYALLDDLDNESDIITIKTELFSTYAIVYMQGLGMDTDGANGFLASLSQGAVALWSLGILVMLGIVIFLIFWKRRKEEES